MPKYKLGDVLYVIDLKDYNNIISFIVDKILIQTPLKDEKVFVKGITYHDKNFKGYYEELCFPTKEIVEDIAKALKEKQSSSEKKEEE